MASEEKAMNVYTTDSIRNVVLLGHGGSGKTSLVYQIKNYIKDNEKLRQKAIMLNFNNILDETGGVELLPYFMPIFCPALKMRSTIIIRMWWSF